MPTEARKNYIRRGYVVTKENWKPKHTQMLLMVQKSHTDDHICAKLAISKSQFDKIKYSPYFQERLRSLDNKIMDKVAEKEAERSVHDKVRERLDKASNKASILLTKALRDPKAITNTQLRVCQDILDRTGHKPKEVIETHERVFAPEEIQSAMQTVKELELTVERLSNTGNPFVLSAEKRKGLTGTLKSLPAAGMSSDTDKGSDVPENPIEETGRAGPPTGTA